MSVNAQPSGAWVFDKNVVQVFDNMVSRSVPLYAETLNLAAKFYQYHGGIICDLGCATGAVARTIPTCDVICIDESQDMLDVCEASNQNARCVKADLRQGLPTECSDAKYFTMLWTAQFIPIEYRQELFAQIYAICKANNGALFIAEKLRGQTSKFQSRLVEQYHDWKNTCGGYSVAEITAKQKSLENQLVSFDAPGIKQCLNAEGWKVEEVIRYLNFAAWYCVP